MANVGSAPIGKPLISQGNGVGPSFKDIGTSSGLTNHGVILGQGNNAFVATSPGTAGQVFVSNGAGADPSFQTGGTSFANTITGNSGGALSPSAGNWNLFGNGSLTTIGAGSTLSFSLTGLTSHAVLVGAGTDTITKIAATANTGAVLQNNSGADPSYSTATYPSTTTINQILFSSAANTVAGITAANSASLVSSSTGVPSWAAMTSGQLIIGNTGGTPTAAVPTSTGGNYITGAGSLLYIPANYMPGSSNIEIAYSAGTFTVQGHAGVALSATNPGYVTLQSIANPGRLVTIAVTANQTFTDGSTGSIDNARFGVTTGVDWASDVPFYLYGVLDDAESNIAFMISRLPMLNNSPASTSISKSGSIINVGQGDFFSLANVTLTSYDNNPAIVLGSFRMQFAGATDSWTVQTLNALSDGIGNFNEFTGFSMVVSQNGATSGKFMIDNGGTAPAWTTQIYNYYIRKSGSIYISMEFNGDGGTDGAGAVAAEFVLPLKARLSGVSQVAIGNIFINNTGITNAPGIAVCVGSSNNLFQMIVNGGLVNNSTFGNGARTFGAQFSYVISSS